MGEWLGDGAVPGRRRVHRGGPVSDPLDVRDTAVLETALAAAIREGDLDPEVEQRAVAAFRAARAASAHRARTRRRDDWRLPSERRLGRPVKMTFGAVIASLTLGGVAVAAIGSVGSSGDGAGTGRSGATARPSAVARDRPGEDASATRSDGPRPTNGSTPAQDTEAHCSAYEQVKGRGKALDARAWQQLVEAAGGEDEVAAYCSEQLARATAAQGRPTAKGKPGAGATEAGNGTAGNTGTSGNGTSGNAADGTANPAGSGPASGGKGGGKQE
ncbi:hypothetical protein ACIO93_34785 [Streptomyces sp. NPDC087903]|uniref:hypothetical protein n=1 Tax=Streptomyces sp. NPDC087903 TaxID=3365819 RepID=UPI00382E5823